MGIVNTVGNLAQVLAIAGSQARSVGASIRALDGINVSPSIRPVVENPLRPSETFNPPAPGSDESVVPVSSFEPTPGRRPLPGTPEHDALFGDDGVIRDNELGSLTSAISRAPLASGGSGGGGGAGGGGVRQGGLYPSGVERGIDDLNATVSEGTQVVADQTASVVSAISVLGDRMERAMKNRSNPFDSTRSQRRGV